MLVKYFGFDGWKDFLTTNLGLNFSIDFILTSITFSAIFAFIILLINNMHSFIGEHLFFPPETFYFALGTILIDWGMAVYGAIRNKKFETTKAKRLVPNLIGNTIFLGLLFNGKKYLGIENDWAGSVWGLLVNAVPTYISLIYIASFVKNGVRAGIFNGKIATYIDEYVDVHKPKLKKKK